MKLKSQVDKPDYKIPTMTEVEAMPWNGYNVVSTFSGVGGSCLGYRMAGYRVLWANEFMPAAQEIYKLNHPNSILNTDDIRDVTGQDILNAIDGQEIDIFDGSPPCDSFSTAGKKSKLWGKEKKYYEKTQSTDDLFFDYARLIKETQPKVFIAENVSGLVKGVSKGYFKIILQALRDCGYNVKARLLDAQWLGVPQARQRVIFIGVRNDLNLEPVFPSPLSYNYLVIDAIPDVLDESDDKITSDNDLRPYKAYSLWLETEMGKNHPVRFNLTRLHPYRPCPTLTTRNNPGEGALYHPIHPRVMTIDELKLLQSFPSDFDFIGDVSKQRARIGLSVPPVMMSHIANTVRHQILDKVK